MDAKCVAGGAGYIASWGIHTVEIADEILSSHNILLWCITGDVSKVRFLKSFPGAETRLVLFKADIYKPHELETAIQVANMSSMLHLPCNMP